MKLLQSVLSLALAAVALASPVLESRQDSKIYKLVLKSGFEELNGQELSLDGNTVGVYPKGGSTLRVYPVATKVPTHYSLHTWPIGIVDHALGLTGRPGLLNFVDVANPGGPVTGPYPVYWETFGLEKGLVTYDAKGQWVAFPAAGGSWTVKWWDGTVPVIAVYQLVSVAYVAV